MIQETFATAPPKTGQSLSGSVLRLAIIGAGPAGLSLALRAAQALPHASICVFDARPADRDVSADPRTLALSLGSVHVLQRLGVWPQIVAQSEPIKGVHVSQQQPALIGEWLQNLTHPVRHWLPEIKAGEPHVSFTAASQGVAQLGAVATYGAIVAPLQAAWLTACEASNQRLSMRFGTPVNGVKAIPGGVEVDADIAQTFDLAVIAEGGVFAQQPKKGLVHDYQQNAWVGTVTLASSHDGIAYERFTPNGPAALLPLPMKDGQHRAALIWCVPNEDDPVEALNDEQRRVVLQQIFHEQVPAITQVSKLKKFPLGLNAEKTLVQGRTIRIGNAAQTLHPVAGQGLNLGFRDAMELVNALQRHRDVDQALKRVEWQRAPDRWALIATTDFLARSFTWGVPGLSTARGLGMVALQRLSPLKSLLAKQMMFGRR